MRVSECVYSKCGRESTTGGLCEKHNNGKIDVETASREDVNAVITCSVCGCTREKSLPRWNAKHGQCQKHLTNERNRKKVREIKEAAVEFKVAEDSKDTVRQLKKDHFQEVGVEVPAHCTLVDLAEYPKVLEKLKVVAKDQVRTLAQQVIFILKESLGEGEY